MKVSPLPSRLELITDASQGFCIQQAKLFHKDTTSVISSRRQSLLKHKNLESNTKDLMQSGQFSLTQEHMNINDAV